MRQIKMIDAIEGRVTWEQYDAYCAERRDQIKSGIAQTKKIANKFGRLASKNPIK